MALGVGKSSMIAATLADLHSHLALPIAIASATSESSRARPCSATSSFARSTGRRRPSSPRRQSPDGARSGARPDRRDRRADSKTANAAGRKASGTLGVRTSEHRGRGHHRDLLDDDAEEPVAEPRGTRRGARMFKPKGKPMAVLIIDDADKWASSTDRPTRRSARSCCSARHCSRC